MLYEGGHLVSLFSKKILNGQQTRSIRVRPFMYSYLFCPPRNERSLLVPENWLFYYRQIYVAMKKAARFIEFRFSSYGWLDDRFRGPAGRPTPGRVI